MVTKGTVSAHLLAVSCRLTERQRAEVADVIGDAARIVYLAEMTPPERRQAIETAAVLLCRNTDEELSSVEIPLLANARLVQFITAGVDFIQLHKLPAVPLASNAGAHAESMAEHAVTMALAGAKRLLLEHTNIKRGSFNQTIRTKLLSGGTCGILGYGGAGRAIAQRMRCLGMKIHAIGRRNEPHESADRIGTLEHLDEMLATADVLIVALALNRSTRDLIGSRELSHMKRDAILVNIARGEIIDQHALYRHLQRQPDFVACLDAWWTEPARHGRFELELPFLDLPNVIGSPHNSAAGGEGRDKAIRRAAENCYRVLVGNTPQNLISDEDRSSPSVMQGDRT